MTGIFETWKACQKQVSGYPGAQFKSFPTRQEAEFYLIDHSLIDTKEARIYTDGSCLGNPGPCAAAALSWAPEGKEVTMVEYLGVGTNNIAELYALGLGLTFVETDSVILSDSQYAINVVEGIWKPKANLELIAKVKTKLSELRQHRKVRFEWVKGHSSDPHNIRVDELARNAISTKNK